MDYLLKFLIITLKTINGNRGSAHLAIKFLYRHTYEGAKIPKFASLDEDRQA